MRPKTWEDLGLLPPPWEPLVSEIEELAGRVVAERRIQRSDLAEIAEEIGMERPERDIAERLVASYVSGAAREERRRRDTEAAKAKERAGRRGA